jgi:hypothetical protein
MTDIHPALQPLATRWATFIDKVRGRVREIEGEAQAAYREVIAHDVVDGTALSGVSSALKSRMQALRAKVDDSWNTIDAEIDKVDIDAQTVGRFRGTQLAIGKRFGRELELKTEEITVRGEAEAARALAEVVRREAGTPIPCTQCGAQLTPSSWHEAVNITCPSCRAVTTASPGTATMMLLRGSGAIQLAREAAWPQWCALQDAEAMWHSLRHKTLDDLARYEQAHRSYWQAYGEAMARVHPGWTKDTIANEVRGKLSWFMDTTAKDDRTVRENNSAGLAAVASGDPAKVHAWAKLQRDPGGACEDLLAAIVERRWHDHAKWLSQVVAPICESNPHELYAEAEYYFATRGD